MVNKIDKCSVLMEGREAIIFVVVARILSTTMMVSLTYILDIDFPVEKKCETY